MVVRFGVCGTLLGLAALLAACKGEGRVASDSIRISSAPERPDEPPVLVTADLPFRYPAALYTQKVQGNVTLRLFIDRNGKARPESTRVELTSGYGALDSAAIRGSQELLFLPAKLRGEAMGVVVLFPVYFRHPEAPPLPGDTILARPVTRP